MTLCLLREGRAKVRQSGKSILIFLVQLKFTHLLSLCVTKSLTKITLFVVHTPILISNVHVHVVYTRKVEAIILYIDSLEQKEIILK